MSEGTSSAGEGLEPAAPNSDCAPLASGKGDGEAIGSLGVGRPMQQGRWALRQESGAWTLGQESL